MVVLVALPTLAEPDAASEKPEKQRKPRLGLARDFERKLRDAYEARVEELGPRRWHRTRTHSFDPDLTPEQREEIRRLEAIGYVDGSTEVRASGVVLHVKQRAHPGLNFFTSGHAPEAILMDMDGHILHRWHYAFRDVWPEYPPEELLPSTQFWRRAYVYPNGDLLAIFSGLGMIKLDKNSQLIWARPIQAHHDLEVMPGGDIYVLTREAHIIPRLNQHIPILEDFITILDTEGREKSRVSVLGAFENSGFAEIWERSPIRTGDIFHTNTVEVLDGRISERLRAFGRGNVLISSPVLDTLAVVDLTREKVMWAHRGAFKRQHDPKVLQNGNLLLFDNQSSASGSSVIEFDPKTGEGKWEYRGTEERPFFSLTCGAADRLPNGNTLITESDGGRAFEVTQQAEVVWEFYNPHRAGDNREFIATLFEVIRLPSGFLEMAGLKPTAEENAAQGD